MRRSICVILGFSLVLYAGMALGRVCDDTPCDSRGIQPSLSVEWGNSPSGLSFGGNFLQNGVTEITVKAVVPTQGIWLGANLGIPLSDALAIYAEGKYLFPQTQEMSFSLFNTGFALQQPELRPMDAKSERWLVGGGARYSLGSNFYVEGGVRYDCHRVMGINPPFTVLGGFLLTSLPTDETEISLSNVIPYAGVGSTIGSEEGRAKITLGLRGFPWFFSKADAAFTTEVALPVWPAAPQARRWSFDAPGTSSYFFEVFGEALFSLSASTSLSLYGRWTGINVRKFASDLNMDGQPANPGGSIIFPSHSAEFGAQRLDYSLGGKVSLSFSLPF